MSLNDFRRETVFERRVRLSSLLMSELGPEIKYGPYAGISLLENVNWGRADLASIILGVYELEVINVLAEEIQARNKFIDIGAGDGLHAVGAAKCLGFRKVVAYEIDAKGRDTVRRMAALNGVTNKISVHGDIFEDRDTDISQSCVLIDIEGAELDLLDQKFAERVTGSTLIVEMHTWTPNFWERWHFIVTLFDRWNVEVISQGPRNPNAFKELEYWPDDNRFLVCSEGRRELGKWAVFRPI